MPRSRNDCMEAAELAVVIAFGNLAAMLIFGLQKKYVSTCVKRHALGQTGM